VKKKIGSIILCILFIVIVAYKTTSLQEHELSFNAPRPPTSSTSENQMAASSTLIVGKITDLEKHENYIRFQTVNIKIITFSPFQITSYPSGESIEVFRDHVGFIGKRIILAFTTTFIPQLMCWSNDSLNRLVIISVDADIKWSNVELTVDNPQIAWRVFTFEGTPIDHWNSTASATTNINAGDYIFFQFNQTTPPTDVNITFYYLPTNALLGVWIINV
jgi:hypothetical protein